MLKVLEFSNQVSKNMGLVKRTCFLSLCTKRDNSYQISEHNYAKFRWTTKYQKVKKYAHITSPNTGLACKIIQLSKPG